jgi:Domain of unknown function (DUF222)
MPCTCGSPHCPAATDKPANPIVINVIAETATVEGTSDKPGYLPGYGAVPAATMQQLAKHASLRPAPTAKDLLAEPNSPALSSVDPVHPLPRSDLPIATNPPPAATLTTPCPAPTGRPIRRTTSRTAESTTCARRSAPAGPTLNSPMEPPAVLFLASRASCPLNPTNSDASSERRISKVWPSVVEWVRATAQSIARRWPTT